MSKISKDTENAIRDAIILEINGRKFFNHAAEVTHHPKGKKMFLHLAQEEVKHLETFNKMFSEILGGSDWKKDLIPDDVTGEAPLVEKLKERLKNEERKGDVEALRALAETVVQLAVQRIAVDVVGVDAEGHAQRRGPAAG